MAHACIVCGRVEVPLFVCSACKRSVFCGAACARLAWTQLGHAQQCAAATATLGVLIATYLESGEQRAAFARFVEQIRLPGTTPQTLPVRTVAALVRALDRVRPDQTRAGHIDDAELDAIYRELNAAEPLPPDDTLYRQLWRHLSEAERQSFVAAATAAPRQGHKRLRADDDDDDDDTRLSSFDWHLAPDEIAWVRAEMKKAARGAENTVVVDMRASNIEINRRDLRRLRRGEWLNDEIINAYGRLLQDDTRAAGALVCVPLTFFVAILVNNETIKHRQQAVNMAANMLRALRNPENEPLRQRGLLLLPVNVGPDARDGNSSGVHWALVVVDLRAATIAYYDSIAHFSSSAEKERTLTLIHQLLIEQVPQFAQPPLRLTLLLSPPNVPQQSNGSDCGVFLCRFMHAFATTGQLPRDNDMDIDAFRLTMVWELLHQRLRVVTD